MIGPRSYRTVSTIKSKERPNNKKQSPNKGNSSIALKQKQLPLSALYNLSALCLAALIITLRLLFSTSEASTNRARLCYNPSRFYLNLKGPSNFSTIKRIQDENNRIKESTASMANKEPLIISGNDQMRQWSRSTRAQGKTIGLVPTMGYLHEGHLSLIEESHKHAHLTVVSIYVNPGQFSPNEDLSTYPKDFLGDIEKLKNIPGGVDVVFHPHNLYGYGQTWVRTGEQGQEEGKVVSCVENSGMGHETWVRVERLEKGLCGNSRPVFFRGVATIVAKLFNIVEPDVAVFGKKDYQQWRIIQRMVRDLDFGIKVIGADLMRDDDGLAKSSRNVRLSPQQREQALSISKSLSEIKCAAEKGRINCQELIDYVTWAIHEAGGKVDYAEIVDQEILEPLKEIKSPAVFCVAAWFGNVRLIDNMEINI